MLKALAISAVFLAVLKAPMPVRGQAANPSASYGDSDQENGNSDDRPADLVAMLDQPQSPPTDGHGQAHGGNNQSESVSITKLPTVSVAKDWTDKIYWLFSGLLVVVGGLQLYFLWGTLNAVKAQAKHMGDQLSLMKDAERAWLLVDRIDIPDDPIGQLIIGEIDDYEDLSTEIAGAEFRMVNYGKTPATVIRLFGRFEIGSSRETPPYPDRVFDRNRGFPPSRFDGGPKTLKPGEEYVIPQGEKRQDLIRPAELTYWSGEKIKRIINDADFLWAYGMVIYRDVYGREHETRFCYRYVVPPEEKESPPHLCLRGPSEYNRCT